MNGQQFKDDKNLHNIRNEEKSEFTMEFSVEIIK